MSVPSDCLYSREHEWVRVDGDIATIGITQHAQQQLGDVVFFDGPEIGRVCDRDDEVGTIESVKAVAELFTPVAGEVTETNGDVVDDPALINASPYESWLVKVRMSNPSDLDALMSPEAYEAFCGEG